MFDKNTPISRRSVLRGAGALMALPFLESLLPFKAFAESKAATPPLRMGIFTVTGGTVLESWKLKESGPLTKLPSILRPLEFAKDDMLLLSGLSQTGKAEGLNGHEHCAFLHLTGAPLAKKESGKPVASISVDQAAAQVAGEQTFLPSLEIGLSNHETKYSFRAPDAPVPYEANPRLVFERMFRGRKPIVPNWSRRRAEMATAVQKSAKRDSLDQSVIDLVLEDAKDLRRKLGRIDQQKLDEYLQSVRTIERRIAFIEAKHHQELLDEKNPGPSKLFIPKDLPPEGMPLFKITQPVERDPERHAEYIRLMADLMILAFQTDTTRVATLAAGSDEALFHGVVTVGYERHCHTLEHQGNAGRVEDADPIAREACRQIHAWYTQLFAEMVRKMKDIDEGGSTLLDNCMILYTSYMADGGHGREDYPVLLAGKAGGTLKTGRQIAFQKKTPMSNLYVEMLERMGKKVESFGDSKVSHNQAYDGRLPGLV
jgi:hypothetical protein